MAYIFPEDYGCVGDGVTDDSDNLLACFAAASNNGDTVVLGYSKWYRTTKNMLLWGAGSILGTGRDSCGITLDADLSESVGDGYETYWFNLGITELPDLDGEVAAATDPWTGSITKCTLNCTANAEVATTTHMVQLHRAEGGWLIEDVEINTEACASDIVMTTMVSAISEWAEVGITPYVKYGTVRRVRHITARSSSVGGPAGINLTSPDHVDVIDNFVWGSGDDACVIIAAGVDAQYNRLINNVCYSVHGRVGILGGNYNTMDGNYHERIRGSDDWADSQLLVCGPPLCGAYSRVPTNCTCTNNVAYLPPGAPGIAALLDLSGGRNITATGNILISDVADVKAIQVHGFYAAEAYGDWEDPDGIDDEIALPRNIVANNNIAQGAYPGYLNEGIVELADWEGPTSYAGNVMDRFNLLGVNVTFAASNRTIYDLMASTADKALRNFMWRIESIDPLHKYPGVGFRWRDPKLSDPEESPTVRDFHVRWYGEESGDSSENVTDVSERIANHMFVIEVLYPHEYPLMLRQEIAIQDRHDLIKMLRDTRNFLGCSATQSDMETGIKARRVLRAELVEDYENTTTLRLEVECTILEGE